MRSRFDPRMIIRRQVISGSRYTSGVMGKTVTLLSYPLWIHSIRPLCLCGILFASIIPPRVFVCMHRRHSVHDRERFTRSRALTHRVVGVGTAATRVRDGVRWDSSPPPTPPNSPDGRLPKMRDAVLVKKKAPPPSTRSE